MVTLALLVTLGISAQAPDEQTPPVTPPSSPAVPLKVMVPELRCPDGSIDEGGVEAVTGLVVLQLSKVPAFSVISGAEIAEMLRLEAEKQVLGCDEDASCLSEIADAMDARLLVTGSMARIGPRTVVNLSLIDSSSVDVVSRSSLDVRRAGEMPYEIKRAVHELAGTYGGIPGFAPPPEAPTSVARLVSDVANHPDTAALFCTAGIGMCSIALPCLPCVPVAQGLALHFGGKDIAGREYPLWWLGSAAGYAALVGGVATGVAVFAWSQTATNNALVNNSLAFAGGALAFGSIFVLEPLAVWGASLLLAEDWAPAADVPVEEAPAAPVQRAESAY